jgi:CheY-like chemotaxis protein
MPSGQEATVLVVEDNATNQLAIRALLERCGVHADFVASGAQAIAAAEAKPYGLILMDLMMPGMDGFETARRIRRMEYGTGRQTPIVAVTAVDPQVCREASIAAGMNGLISKPIDPEALTELIARWKTGAGTARATDQREAARLLESFLDVTTRLLAELSEAIATGDLSTATYLAHEVKASSLVVSAGEMAELARVLEQTIREERWAKVVDDYRALVAAFKRTTEGLRTPVQAILEQRIGRYVKRVPAPAKPTRP